MTESEKKLCDQAYDLLKLIRKLEIVPHRRLAKMIKTFPLCKYESKKYDKSP